MIFVALRRLFLAVFFGFFSLCSYAQFAADDPDWAESDAPPPPMFDLQRLVPFDVSPNSPMKWGFDPQAMTITGDGIVRYVVVAQSPSGVVNAMYEAVRCATGGWKTYARWNKDGAWNIVPNPQWRPMYDFQPALHALRLAHQGICTGNAPAYSVRDAVRNVRQFGQSQ
jgi:hypothetical protein